MHHEFQKDEKEMLLDGNAQNRLLNLSYGTNVALPNEDVHNAVWHSFALERS